jgi:hypothetical protein|uniref:Uncharacterized protein n=1 Tax=viral metagenome TaxID=1070528 RepID=A0A6C0BPH4_9ZZZZ
MNILYVLNSKTHIFSTYAKDKSIVFTSYDGNKLSQMRNILNDRYCQTNTWMKHIEHVYLFAENHIQIDLIDNKHCNINDPIKSLDITLFNTHNQTDMSFIYHLKHLLNTTVYVIKDLEYSCQYDIPILSLQGFFIEYQPEDMNIEPLIPYEYLDSIYNNVDY